ncbi:MAG: iron complex outermembrane receptor protein [Cocleimonas sp.]
MRIHLTFMGKRMSGINKTKILPMSMISIAVSIAISGQAYAAEEQSKEVLENHEIEVISVTGLRSSLDRALQNKRNSDSLVDGIAAEDIGKFPDQNVAEALQRITGVSISRTNGEGAQVTVRGFGPEFNQVRINDRLMASATKGRDFDFQQMPSELISGADIIKTPTANISEGSIGALINIRTARPIDSDKLTANFSAKARYNDLADEVDPQLSGIVSNSFLDNTFGVLVGVSYVESNNRTDMTGGVRSSVFDGRNGDINGDSIMDADGSPISVTDLRFPGRQEYRVESETRERFAVNSTLQWIPSDNVLTTLDIFYTDFNRQGAGFGIQAPLQSGAFSNVHASEDNTLTAGTTTPQRFDMLQIDQGSDSQTYLIGFDTDVDYDTWSLHTSISHSQAKSDNTRSDLVPQIGSGNGIDDLGFISFDSRNSDVMEINTNIDVADTRNVRAHWNNTQTDEIKDEISEFKLSGIKELELEILDSVEAGIFYTQQTKSVKHYGTDGNQDCFATCGSGLQMSESLFGVLPFNDYLSNESGNFPRQWTYIKDVAGYKQELSDLKGFEAFSESYVPRASTEVEEETSGAFIQANFEGGEIADMPWSGNIGLRYFKTSVESSGADQVLTNVWRNDPDNPNTTALLVSYSDEMPLTSKNDYSDILPSINFKLDITENWVFRTAAAKVITRPTIDSLGVAQAYQTSNIESFGVISGNPTLEPFEVYQLDASFEYYADNGNAYTLAFYAKDIKTFISESTVIEDSGFDLSSNFGDDINLMQARTANQNRDGGRITGFELAGTHFFDYLPGWLSGMGIQANYTYANSKDDNILVNELPAVQQTEFGVEGFAENTFNTSVFYDKDDFQARIAYNWRDEYLLSRRGSRSFGLPEIVDAYGQFDLSMSYNVNEDITISFEGVNITDERTYITEDVKDRVSLISYSGRRFTLGVNVSF